MDMNMGSSTASSGSSADSMVMMMQMYFYASAKATILFEPWATKTWAEMLGSCIGVAVFSILYEGLKASRVWLIEYVKTTTASIAVSHSDSTTSVVAGDAESDADDLRITTTPTPRWHLNCSVRTISILFHVLQSVLHIVQVGLGYLLMLISMTFNAYLFISIIIGAGIGYFLFNYKRPVVIHTTEHCH